MTTIEELQKVVDEIGDELFQARYQSITRNVINEWSIRLQSIIDRAKAEQEELDESIKALVEKRWPVSSKPPKDEFIGAAPPVPEGMKLPCDVRLPPNLIIRKGCKIETLMEALKVREGRDVRWADPKEAAKSMIAAAEKRV